MSTLFSTKISRWFEKHENLNDLCTHVIRNNTRNYTSIKLKRKIIEINFHDDLKVEDVNCF